MLIFFCKEPFFKPLLIDIKVTSVYKLVEEKPESIQQTSQ